MTKHVSIFTCLLIAARELEAGKLKINELLTASVNVFSVLALLGPAAPD